MKNAGAKAETDLWADSLDEKCDVMLEMTPKWLREDEEDKL